MAPVTYAPTDQPRRSTMADTHHLHTLRIRLIHYIVRYTYKHAHTSKPQICVDTIYELEDQLYSLLPRWYINKYAYYHWLEYPKELA